jgi:hypothetical protein
MITFHNWYNLNSTRRYPIDTAATGEGDNGENLPDDVLLDCYLRFPNTAGNYAYVGSVHSTPQLVSLTFIGSPEPAVTPLPCPDVSISISSSSSSSSSVSSSSSSSSSSPVLGELAPAPVPLDSVVPLAVLSLPRANLVPNQQYMVEPLIAGVGGWVVFGVGLENQSFMARFSSVQQTMLMPRVCQAYKPLPVPSMSKLYHPGLQDKVTIAGAGDVEVVSEQRTIEGITQDALIVRLRATPDGEEEILSQFVGPCGGRPESGTCSKLAIETINTVEPDCSGNLVIDWTGTCVEVGTDDTNEGQIIDFCIGLSSACLDDNFGLLTFINTCSDELRFPAGVGPGDFLPPDPVPVPGLPSISISEMSCSNLPITESLTDGNARDFTVASGSFAFQGGIYTSTDPGRRNVSIWPNCGYDSVEEKVATLDLRLNFTATTAATSDNGGLIFGFTETGTTTSVQQSYYIAEIDKFTDTFRIKYWTGTHFVEVAASPPGALGLTYGTDYTIEVSLTSASPTLTDVTAVLKAGVSPLVTISPSLNNLKDTDIWFGLGANRSITQFLVFTLADL